MRERYVIPVAPAHVTARATWSVAAFNLAQAHEPMTNHGHNKQQPMDPKKEPVKWPLFRITPHLNSCLYIVAKDHSTALSKALTIWKKKGTTPPDEIVVKKSGTVDYIPKMTTPHWEI